MSRSRIIVALVVASLVWATPATAQEADEPLPDGWTVEGDHLVWASDDPIRLGAARWEFRSGDTVLGYPVEDGDSLRLTIPAGAELVDLSVWRAGRQVDPPTPFRRQSAPPVEPATTRSAFNPAAPGPYATQRLEYELPGLAVEGYEADLEVVAEVTAPVGAAGELPLVLFLHGRHSTCYIGGPDGEASGDWPCPEGWSPVPSHTGYRYITDVLASQGYLAVSISANGINGQDAFALDAGASARSQLVRHHLALWGEWNATGGDPWGGEFQGRVNLDEVVLVGHSRGGEGVERATIDTDATDPWRIQGLLLIGPTAFGRQVAAGVHTAVILPFCDGDVSDLQGQQYVDLGRDLTADLALRTSVMAMGTNHNFYNTEWTPGLSESPAWDDWFDPNDPQCGENRSRRLTPTEQQAVGLAYTAALVELAIDDNTSAVRLLDGSKVRPPSIGRASTVVHAIGGAKELVYAPGTGVDVTATGPSASECRGYFIAGPFDLRSECAPELYSELLPHWLPMYGAETQPGPVALGVSWSAAGGSVRIPVNADLTGASALDFRIAIDPASAPVSWTLRLRDGSGAAADVRVLPARLRGYRGFGPLAKVAARQYRAALSGVTIDLTDLRSMEIVPTSGSGRMWLLDVSTWRNGLPPVDQIHLPRVNAADLEVIEGTGETTTVDMPITIDGTLTEDAEVWVQLTDYTRPEPFVGFPLVLPAGTTSVSVPITYEANDVFDPWERTILVTLAARDNAVTGEYLGSVRIIEDDEPPVLTIEPALATAVEGEALEWTVSLSEPMANWAFWSILPVPYGGVEIDSDDLPDSFLEQYGIERPSPAIPFSELGIWLGVEFEPGQTSAVVTLPILDDGVDEPDEGVALLLESFGDPVVPESIRFEGVVTGG